MKILHGVDSFKGRIRRFRDGDTANIEMEIGWDVIICRGFRFVGIESWELDGHDRPRAIAAANALTEIFHDQEVLIVPSTRGLDCYGRIRGRMTHAGGDVATQIVNLGFAWWDVKRGTPAGAPR